MSLKKKFTDLSLNREEEGRMIVSPRVCWFVIVAGSLNILISVVRLATALSMGYVNTGITVQVIVGIVSGSMLMLSGIYHLRSGPNGPSIVDFYRALLTRSCTRA